MKLKWQWFIGGRIMFWVTIILFIALILGFISTYVIDPTTYFNMKVQNVDETSIKEISENYVKNLGIKINKPVVYRFVKYKNGYDFKKVKDNVLLGTFHEWNGTYYIDISIDLYKMSALSDIVIHETRHMIVEYLKDEKIINLDEYTENIAQETDAYCNNLFENGVNLLKDVQENKRIK